MLPVYCYQTVPTVLDIAHGLCDEGKLPVFGSVLAQAQTSGRGQMRRVWHSPPGNIYCAVRLPEDGPFGGLSAAPALGAVLADSLASLGLPIALKWPNDLIIKTGSGWGKTAGILLEKRKHLIAGIGLNLAQAPPPEMLRADAVFPAASLLGAVGRERVAEALTAAKTCGFQYIAGDTAVSFPPGIAMTPNASAPEERTGPAAEASFRPGGKNWFSLFEYLVCGIKVWYDNFVITKNGTDWRDLASKHLAFLGKEAVVEDALLSEGENSTVRGIISGLGESGELRLQTRFGVKNVFGGSLRIAETGF
ncbi:MAG: hypothetical protein J5855_09130 [Mailhella sp.]|nr:hypothetical protein [Mailhella sp.]